MKNIKSVLVILCTVAIIAGLSFFSTFATDTTSGTTKEPPIMACTMEYAPVCGRLNATCPSGAECQIALPKTYGNMCQLNIDKAEFLYKGECKNESPKPTTPPVMCTMEYAPVCGKKDGVQMTYGNKCTMNAEKASYISMGECETKKLETPKNTDTKMYKGDTKTCQLIKFACDEGTQYFSDSKGCGCEKAIKISETSKLPEALRLKMQKTIENFIVRLEAKGYTNEKNIATLEEVSTKLEKLAKQPKYKNLALYAVELIENAKVKYEDDFSELENIFSDF